jgi:hypothetical protein
MKITVSSKSSQCYVQGWGLGVGEASWYDGMWPKGFFCSRIQKNLLSLLL